jgi:hypothetical protein
MTPTRATLMPLYWERPDHSHLWQLLFDKPKNRRPLLTELLKYLPAELGTVEFLQERGRFLEEHRGRRFVVLLTYDEASEGAWQNAFRICYTLAATDAVRLICAEGAWGRIAVEWLRVFPEPKVLWSLVQQELSERRIQPHEAAAILVEHEKPQ